MFISESINVIHCPFQAPKANSFAERWVRSEREECLDHILIINQNHLHRVLKEHVNYYNHHRPLLEASDIVFVPYTMVFFILLNFRFAGVDAHPHFDRRVAPIFVI